MLLRNIVALSLLTASTAIQADALDFSLRDNSVQLQYFAPMGRDSLGTSELHAGFLYNNNNNNNKSRIFDIGLLVKGAVGESDSGVTAGVGLKGLIASTNVNSALAIALGGQVRVAPPAVPRLGIVGQLYFSPSIVTFRDAERYFEMDVRVEYELISQAAAYLGYRTIKVTLKTKNEIELDSGVFAGVRMSF
jgi:hypothetical protein